MAEEGKVEVILSSVLTTPVVKFGTTVHTIYLVCSIIPSTQGKFEVHSEISHVDPYINVPILCSTL